MSKYDKYKESAFTHEEMQPMIIETDMTDIVERLRLIDPTLELRYCEDVTKLHEIGRWCHEAAAEIERLREALREIAEFKHPDRHGYELQDIAIAALKESGDG